MNRLLLTTCAICFFAVPAFAEDVTKADNQHGPDQSVAVEMGYRTMDNGSVVYEEVEPAAGTPSADQNPEDIAPAAGNTPAQANAKEDASAAPTFHYDPLTQTYRRVTVDKQGNSRQDVINTAR